MAHYVSPMIVRSVFENIDFFKLSASRTGLRSRGRIFLQDFIEQFDQQLEPRAGYVRELALVKVMNGLIERLQQLEPLWRDAGLYDASIIFLALASDQSTFLHAVEKTRHVWIMRNHAVGNAAARQPFRFGATQNAKRVVLRCRQIVRFQELLHLLAKSVRGLLQ
jgi:hypothetical protein